MIGGNVLSVCDIFVQVRDMVFVHSNLRLCEKVADIGYEEKTVDWSSESESDGDGEQNAE